MAVKFHPACPRRGGAVGKPARNPGVRGLLWYLYRHCRFTAKVCGAAYVNGADLGLTKRGTGKDVNDAVKGIGYVPNRAPMEVKIFYDCVRGDNFLNRAGFAPRGGG